MTCNQKPIVGLGLADAVDLSADGAETERGEIPECLLTALRKYYAACKRTWKASVDGGAAYAAALEEERKCATRAADEALEWHGEAVGDDDDE